MKALANWLDIRPEEVRSVTLATAGAFLVLAFMILGRSLREALYLHRFGVKALPYITASVALLSLPVVAVFTMVLSRSTPSRVLRSVIVVVAVGLAGACPVIESSRAAVVCFYLWTALGTLLLTSGFWVVTSECFPVRSAKRLYGLIGAGGTTGALVMGASLKWLTQQLSLPTLVLLLDALLLLFLTVQILMPKPAGSTSGRDAAGGAPPSSMRENLALLWRTPHLRTIGLIVFTATAASSLVDFQFKAMAKESLSSQAELTGFLGAFYGWTGGIALFIQIFLASKVIGAGVTVGLAILPVLLLLGSTGLLFVPGLVAATLLRGTDNSLRRSLFRPVLELLYVPLTSDVRRKTKTIIDSVVDSGAEGVGAALLFVWITLLDFPIRYLSVFVVLLALLLLWLSRQMGRQYFRTVASRLREEETHAALSGQDLDASRRDLLEAVFASLNMSEFQTMQTMELYSPGVSLQVRWQSDSALDSGSGDTLAMLGSDDDATVMRGLARVRTWDRKRLDALLALLARDSLYDRLAKAVPHLGTEVLSDLCRALQDATIDFVTRRRIPAVLAGAKVVEADDALLDALAADRFEVRYRAAISLVRRRDRRLPHSDRDWRELIWSAVRAEVSRGRPVWEMNELLDDLGAPGDGLVAEHVGARGTRSLEHTFRILTLVLDSHLVRAAFRGVTGGNEQLRSFALEYLEQALPGDVRKRLWLFIGDLSQHKRRKELRPLQEVAQDLLQVQATLFAGDRERQALEQIAGPGAGAPLATPWDGMRETPARYGTARVAPAAGAHVVDGPVLGRIDRYLLLEKLGEGGFGVVYLARDEVAGVDVALKVLPPVLAQNPEEMEELRENFKLVTKLRHPNIANALYLHEVERIEPIDEVDLGVFKGDDMIVMDYVPGQTIADWRQRYPEGRVPLAETLRVAERVAAALDYAHSRRVMHRDIKPANVIVTPSGDVRVLDFGLAAQIRSSVSRASEGNDGVCGTPAYMAPEQWAGKHQGPRSDQYALAVLLYEMIGGRVPFADVLGVGGLQVMFEAVMYRTPEPLSGVSRRQNRALLRALSKEPRRRFESCGQFVEVMTQSPGPLGSSVSGMDGRGILASDGARRLAFVSALAVSGAAAWLHWAGRFPVPAAWPGSVRDGTEATDVEPEGLARDAGEALSRGKYAVAADLVRRLLEEEPEDVEAKALREQIVRVAGLNDVVPVKSEAEVRWRHARALDRGQGFNRLLSGAFMLLDSANGAFARGDYGHSLFRYQEFIARCDSLQKRGSERQEAFREKEATLTARRRAERAASLVEADAELADVSEVYNKGVLAFQGGQFEEAAQLWVEACAGYTKAEAEAKGRLAVRGAKDEYRELKRRLGPRAAQGLSDTDSQQLRQSLREARRLEGEREWHSCAKEWQRAAECLGRWTPPEARPRKETGRARRVDGGPTGQYGP